MHTRAHPGILLYLRACLYLCLSVRKTSGDRKDRAASGEKKTTNALNSARVSPEQHYHKAPCQEWPSLTLSHLIKLLKKAGH